MSKINIKNRAKEERDQAADSLSKRQQVLQYFHQWYPWLTCQKISDYTSLYLKNTWFGYNYGLICEIQDCSSHLDVDVYADSLGTEEFGKFLSTVYPEKDIFISIREYKNRKWWGF